VKKWIIYCEEKNQLLKSNVGRIATFDDVIVKLEEGQFLVLNKDTSKYGNQSRFIVRVNNYPIEVPFNERNETIQLITLFPNRKFK